MILAIVARLTSKGLISAALVAVTAVAALASCGSPSEDGEAGVGFAGSTNLRRHLEARTACGRAIGAGAEPAFCRVD
jgi:hypothetical protein